MKSSSATDKKATTADTAAAEKKQGEVRRRSSRHSSVDAEEPTAPPSKVRKTEPAPSADHKDGEKQVRTSSRRRSQIQEVKT